MSSFDVLELFWAFQGAFPTPSRLWNEDFLTMWENLFAQMFALSFIADMCIKLFYCAPL